MWSRSTPGTCRAAMVATEAPSRLDVRCAHCGLPVASGLIDPGADEQFCCHGCRGARELICSLGLDGYYRIRGEQAAGEQSAVASGRTYEEYDHEAFLGRYAEPLGDGSMRVRFLACSIHCAACVWLIEKLPRIVDGVIDARVDLGRRSVEVRWDPARVALSRIARQMDGLGYAPSPWRGRERHEAERRHNRDMIVRLGVSGALAGNVMLISFALYGGVFHGIDALYESLFRWVSLLLSVVSLAWPGSVFFRGAVASLKTRSLHMDTPVALGLLAGGVSGAINTVRGTGEVYFDSVTALVFLLLMGRYLQHRKQQRASDALELLGAVTPSAARLVAGDDVRPVPIEALQAGDVVEVLAGEVVPADGEVSRGESSMDYSVLTGESEPIQTGAGDAVPAGAVNLSAVIRVRVSATGEATRIGRLMSLVRDAAMHRAPIARLADRVAQRFIAVVLTLAVVTFGVWMVVEPSRALGNTVALLIVTCPCALGLATPLALAASIGRGAQHGFLIKGGDSLEALAHRGGTIVLDKTGTITRGAVSLVEWIGDEEAKALVGAGERDCAHPIARALTRAFDTEGLVVERSAYEHGGGLTARVDGRELVIGSPEYVEERVGGVDRAFGSTIESAGARALTPVVVAVDGRVSALALLGDPIRDDASEMIGRARAMGWDVVMLSGDHPRVARAVGERLGLDASASIGGATPEQKAAFVRACAARPVVMVGDGVNDAAAMMSADVGVAVHGGAEASMQAADVYLSNQGLNPLVELLDGARRTIRTIKVCMVVSASYNLVCAGLAVSGLITPLLAAVLMPLSSLTVVTIAYRSGSFGRGSVEPGSWN